MSDGALARLRRMSAQRRRLFFRATALLALASLAVALLPFRCAVRLGSVPLGRRSEIAIPDLLWAVESAARCIPLRTVCIEKGLVVQRMLRSAGAKAMLHYGARHGEGGELEAHVWVSIGSLTVFGGEEAAGFAELTVFP